MYVVSCITCEKLWGDQRLQAYSGDVNCNSIGIVYTVSGTKDLDCEIENHQEKTTLYTKMQEYPSLFGLKGNEFPIIIAFDACRESVSFQIHPTDEYAKEKYRLPYGKSEAWYFIEKPTEGWVYAENPKESLVSVKQASETHDFEGVVGKKEVNEQDCVYIRSGTIHALTKGSLIYEIQQSTNITYRLYDYDRLDSQGKLRPLHLQEAYDNLNPSLKIHKQPLKINDSMKQREFELEHKILNSSFTNEKDIVVAISILNGSIDCQDYSISKGQSILVLPHETIEFEGECEAMLAWPSLYWTLL